MFVRRVACAFLLAASAAAQLTIQTSVPESVGTSASQCQEVCFVEPCAPCSTTTEGEMSILPITTTTTEEQMSIPPGETPISTALTNPLQSTTGEMSIPQGETPIPSGETPIPSDASIPSRTRPGTSSDPASSPNSASSPSTSSSPTQSQAQSGTPGAAASALKGDGTPFIFAVIVTAMSTLGFAWVLL